MEIEPGQNTEQKVTPEVKTEPGNPPEATSEVKTVSEEPITEPNKGWTKTRRRLIGLNILIMLIIAIVIFTAINHIASRYYIRQDCTFRQTYALSDKTKNILKQLPQPVSIYALLVPNHQIVPRLKDLLQEYKMRSPKINVEEINIVDDPTLANARIKYLREENKISAALQPNDIIFVCGNKSKVINIRDTYTPKYDQRYQEVGIDTFKGEEVFSSAILSIIQSKKIKVYFTQGHEEPKLDGKDDEGIFYLDALLKGENMDTETIDLRKKGLVPEDAEILAIPGPATPLLPEEINMMANYLAKGGKVLLMVGVDVDAHLDGVLKDWGIMLNNDLVMDRQCAQILGVMKDPRMPLVNDYGPAFDHPITRDLKERNLNTPFIFCRSIEEIQPPPAGLEIVEIARSSRDSWGETTDIKTALEEGKAQFDKGEKRGPLTLAVAIKKSLSPAAPQKGQGPETRIVVMGCSDMIKNRFLYPRSNYYMGPNDLVMNSIRWLARQEQFISIESKKPEDTSINFNVGKRSLILLLVSLLFIPLSGVILGIVVWLMRRK